jgi:hypothetical protein
VILSKAWFSGRARKQKKDGFAGDISTLVGFKFYPSHYPLGFKEKSRQEVTERFDHSFLSTGLPLPLASFKHSPCDFQLICHSTAEFIQFVPTKRFPVVKTNQHRFHTPLRHKRKFPRARKQARKPTLKISLFTVLSYLDHILDPRG